MLINAVTVKMRPVFQEWEGGFHATKNFILFTYLCARSMMELIHPFVVVVVLLFHFVCKNCFCFLQFHKNWCEPTKCSVDKYKSFEKPKSSQLMRTKIMETLTYICNLNVIHCMWLFLRLLIILLLLLLFGFQLLLFLWILPTYSGTNGWYWVLNFERMKRQNENE